MQSVEFMKKILQLKKVLTAHWHAWLLVLTTESISRLILGFQNSHGIPLPDQESIDSSLRQMCVSISERHRFARISLNERDIAHLALWDAGDSSCMLSSCCFTLRRRRRRPAGTQREAGGSTGGAPGRATGWPASPSPGGCNLLLRDPATYVGLLSPSFMCALLSSLSSSYPPSRGSAFTIVYYKSGILGFALKRRTSRSSF